MNNPATGDAYPDAAIPTGSQAGDALRRKTVVGAVYCELSLRLAEESPGGTDPETAIHSCLK